MLLSLYKAHFLAVIFNHETLRHEVIGAAAAGVAMAAVPISEDSAFTSYLYVHTAYTVNCPMALKHSLAVILNM